MFKIKRILLAEKLVQVRLPAVIVAKLDSLAKGSSRRQVIADLIKAKHDVYE